MPLATPYPPFFLRHAILSRPPPPPLPLPDRQSLLLFFVFPNSTSFSLTPSFSASTKARPFSEGTSQHRGHFLFGFPFSTS